MLLDLLLSELLGAPILDPQLLSHVHILCCLACLLNCLFLGPYPLGELMRDALSFVRLSIQQSALDSRVWNMWPWKNTNNP